MGNSADSRDRWETSLAGVIDPLNATGVPVVIISSYPTGDDYSITRSFLVRPDANRSTDAASQHAGREWLIELESDLAAKYDDVYVYDPYEVFCDQALCRTAVGGVEYYTDANHLSRAGSLNLAPSLAALLEFVLG